MELEQSGNDIIDKSILIEIYGLGYIGFPLAVRLASNGFNILGVDINKERIQRLQKNILMDSEIHLQNEFSESLKKENLSLSISPKQTEKHKIGIICVPTPIPKQSINSDAYVISAVENFLNFAKNGDVIILESSIEVGTTEKIEDIIRKKGFQVGKDFGLCFCPERIDPANKEWGIENIPRVIYCSDDNSYKIALEVYKAVNEGNLIRVDSPKIAEVVKSFENAFRLVNISLVNELAMLCDKLGISAKSVIDAAATKPFGFMPHYPGAGAGGHCIPKDPRFLLESAKKFKSKFETIENALNVNILMPNYIANTIEKSLEKMKLEKSILVCGLSYKANVEDMRDSPSYKIVNELNRKHFKVFGYDPYFNMEFVEKYLIENNMKNLNFKILDELNNEVLKSINSMCIVQHHSDIENKINEIYSDSIIPYIYDCQNKLNKNSKSKTVLEFLGN